jgi:SAM-dependent methyltransferase
MPQDSVGWPQSPPRTCVTPRCASASIPRGSMRLCAGDVCGPSHTARDSRMVSCPDAPTTSHETWIVSSSVGVGHALSVLPPDWRSRMPISAKRPLAVLVITALGVEIAMSASNFAQDAMFSEARAYERFMGRWSRQLAPLLVRFASVRDGDALLDVGSGTGALTAALVTAAPAGRIVGIDPAASYVALAQASQAGPRVQFTVGDAQQMQFADASFDRTLSLLVVNFIPDVHKAMAEMKRVTRGGGTVAAAVWDYGDGMEMLRVFWDEAVKVTPAADRRDERHMPFCRPGELAALWRQHGLQDVVEEGLTIETRFASFADYWEPFLGKQGPAGAHVVALSTRERDELEQRLRKRLLGEGGDRAFVLEARAWAVRGVVR